MPRKHKCLMIHTKDHRKFFTECQNFPNLIEFSKTFNAEISLVKIEDGTKILDLKDLAPAICSMDRTAIQIEPEYEFVEQKLPVRREVKRKKILQHAEKIRAKVREQFLTGKPVSLQSVCKRYGHIGKLELSKSCICKHIMAVKDDLTAEGFQFQKLGAGRYKLILGSDPIAQPCLPSTTTVLGRPVSEVFQKCLSEQSQTTTATNISESISSVDNSHSC